MADGVPAQAFDMQEMRRAIMEMQQEILTLRAAAAVVEQDVNAQIQHAVQHHVAAAAQAPAAAYAPAALGRARAKAPDEWKGDPTDISLNDWLAQLNTYFECTDTQDIRQQVLVAAGCLRGAAGTWWRTRYEEYINEARPLPATIAELIAALRRQFGRIYQNADYRRDWTALRQGGKDVAEYTHQYKQIVMHIEDTNDGEKLFRYVEGLNQRIRVRVEIERPRNLERAIELAAAWEGPISHADADYRRQGRRVEGRRSEGRRTDHRHSERRSRSRGRRNERGRYRGHYERPRYTPQGDPMELGQRRVRFDTSRSRSHDRSRSSSRGTSSRDRSKTPGKGILRRPSDAEGSRAEGSRRAETRECFRCGRRGHLAVNCRQEN